MTTHTTRITTTQLTLAPFGLSASRVSVGAPQRAGALTVLPLFGPDHGDRVCPPRSGIKLTRVEGYGNVELRNDGGGVAIVPLHIGWIQDRAQNHALCRSALLADGQTLMFRDACCVQAAQGGYLEGRDQWFFVLPVELRARALELGGVENYAKLWEDIALLNRRYGLRRRGHLEQLIAGRRARLTQQASRFEPLPAQTGAVVLLERQGQSAPAVLGLELCPGARYFAEIWPALACFCYGPLAMAAEAEAQTSSPPAPLAARSLGALRGALEARRAGADRVTLSAIAALPAQRFEARVEERLFGLELSTVRSAGFAGQLVRDGDDARGAPLYASLVSPSAGSLVAPASA